MSEKKRQAVELFNARYGCAQSVAAVFCEDYGLDRKQTLKLACAFGGGCRSAELCGAVAGAAIIIGLRYGQHIEGDMEAREQCNTRMSQFIEQFRTEFGDIVCRKLLGFDLTTPEGKAEYDLMIREQSPCVGFVGRTVELLEEDL